MKKFSRELVASSATESAVIFRAVGYLLINQQKVPCIFELRAFDGLPPGPVMLYADRDATESIGFAWKATARVEVWNLVFRARVIAIMKDTGALQLATTSFMRGISEALIRRANHGWR
jgi:hypothetical protein